MACGKSGAGESCNRDSDCASGTCALNFHCAPGECECTGAECGSAQSTCGAGQVCTAGQPPFDIGYNRCRSVCDATKPCAGGRPCMSGYCGTDGIDLLSWANIPRSIRCKVDVPCVYELHVRPEVTVNAYRWTFSDKDGRGNTSDTKEPSTTHVFHAGGSFGVSVVGVTSGGETLPVTTLEVLCGGAIGDACDANVAECCLGSCLQGQCK